MRAQRDAAKFLLLIFLEGIESDGKIRQALDPPDPVRDGERHVTIRAR
jgi:hypothetical protein